MGCKFAAFISNLSSTKIKILIHAYEEYVRCDDKQYLKIKLLEFSNPQIYIPQKFVCTYVAIYIRFLQKTVIWQ